MSLHGAFVCASPPKIYITKPHRANNKGQKLRIFVHPVNGPKTSKNQELTADYTALPSAAANCSFNYEMRENTLKSKAL